MGILLPFGPSAMAQRMACIRSGDVEGAADVVTPWAGAGTALHEVAERAANSTWGEALAQVPARYRRLAANMDLPELERVLGGDLRDGWTWGLGLAWNPWTGEAVVLGIGMTHESARKAAAVALADRAGRWLVGVLDLCAELDEDRVVVVDLKTGHRAPPPAEDCWQTKCYSAMLAGLTGAQQVDHGCLWMPEGQGPRWEHATLDEVGLLEVASAVMDLVERLDEVGAMPEDQRPRPAHGEHCAYCPQGHRCRARVEQLQLLGALERVEGRPVITSENAAAVYHRLHAARALCDDAEAALKVLASVEPIDLGDGRVYGPMPWTERSVDPGKVFTAAVEAGLSPEQARGLVRSVSKTTVSLTALEEGFVAAMLPDEATRKGKAAGLKRQIVEALDKAGGLRVHETTRIQAHKPKKERIENSKSERQGAS